MPYDGGGNRHWLHEHLGSRIQPQLLGQGVWAIARPHLRHLVNGLADRFGRVDVFLEFRESERCDTRCQNAVGDDCTCSCLGVNHGGAAYWMGWVQVGETTLVASTGVLTRHLVVTAHR